jgi:Xaa-Pro aminopeptidase
LCTSLTVVENIIACVKRTTAHNFGNREYLGFQTISFAPLCRNLIDATLLSPQERAWVDAYHTEVFSLLSNKVQASTQDWLKRECAPL